MEDRGTCGVITGAKLGASPEESLPSNNYCSPTFPFRLSIGPLGAGVGPRATSAGWGEGSVAAWIIEHGGSAQAHFFFLLSRVRN